MSEEKYITSDWKGFLQQIIYLVSRGYTNYCLVEYPEKKKDKFISIDQKLIEKYGCNKTRSQNYYAKTQGFVNFRFLRSKNVAIILKTKGKLKDGLILDDQFFDIEKKPIKIDITEITSFEIKKNGKGKFTVFMAKDFFQYVKVVCAEWIENNNVNAAVADFNKLNGFPAWSGINEQKGKLKKYLYGKIKKSGTKFDPNRLRIYTKRTPVKVFEENE